MISAIKRSIPILLALAICGASPTSTYESFSYLDKSQELHKCTVVYLPYGYNEQEKYNVFYLMHGGRSNMLDHAIWSPFFVGV